MSATATTRTRAPHRLLFGPGPTTPDPRVLEAMSQPVVGIRDPYFYECMAEVQRGLRSVFGTQNAQTFPVPGTGSAGMEAAIGNFVTPGAKVAVLANGLFADRQAEMARRHGGNVVRLEKAWGEVFTQAEVEAFIDRERPAVVAFVQGETSTGVIQSMSAVAAAAKASGALTIADCVTPLGAMPVEVDAAGVDVAYSCTQKGLSCASGLAPITVSPRAWEWLQQRKEPMPGWYLDLRLLAKWYAPEHAYHHTPSATLFYGLREGLAVIEEEGLKNRWDRHHRAHLRLLEGLGKLGFTPFVAEGHRMWHMNTVLPPAGVDEAALRRKLLDNHGIDVASGIGQLAGKILRIGIMGPLATDDKVDLLLESIAASM